MNPERPVHIERADGSLRAPVELSRPHAPISVVPRFENEPVRVERSECSERSRNTILLRLRACAWDERKFKHRHDATARMLNVTPVICPQRICRASLDGKIVFRDFQHLTASFAESLGPALAGKLGMAMPAADASGDSAKTVQP